MRIRIYISVFILLVFAGLSRGKAPDLELTGEIDRENIAGCGFFLLDDTLYIAVAGTDVVQFFRVEPDAIKEGEKFKLTSTESRPRLSRSLSAGIFQTREPSPRLWLFSNLLPGGYFYDFGVLAPFVGLKGYQPVATGFFNGEKIVFFTEFRGHTDILDGTLQAFSLTTAKHTGTVKIPGFYTLRNIRSGESSSGDYPWSWLVLCEDNKLILYNEFFTESEETGVMSGCFSLTKAERMVLFYTDGAAETPHKPDTLYIASLNPEDKPPVVNLDSKDIDGRITSMDSITYDGDIYLAIIQKISKSMKLKIFIVEL